ncbi:hypothetical protein C8F01DRAFT_1137114 [Mycena amicta]|nr:hypothetical protein C8F01DRAFT_1137114 [Mycena amicta]
MSSPFASHLGSNYSPKDEEIQDIKDVIVKGTNRLHQLDSEIAELQKTMDKLVDERQLVHSDIEAHQALLSPLRRVPIDVIREIFVACLPEDRHCVMSAQEAPVLLGRICSSWRAIALSTPSLWSTIHIAEPWLSRYSPATSFPRIATLFAARLEAATEWLSRSGSMPLSISIFLGALYTHYPQQSVPDQTPLLDLVVSHSRRWRSVHFHIPITHLQHLAKLGPEDVPMLQSITFDHKYIYLGRDDAQWAPPGRLLDSPNLTSFSISGVNIALEHLPFPCQQLTSLTLGETIDQLIFSETVLRLLTMCPLLRTLDVRLARFSEEWKAATYVESSHLRSLSLRCLSYNPNTLEILDFLTLPQLRDMTIQGRGDFEHTQPSFSRFFQATPLLESFYLELESVSPTPLLHVLRCLPPTIQRLGLEELDSWTHWEDVMFTGPFQLTDAFLEALTPGNLNESNNPGPVLFPQLRTLVLRHCSACSDAGILRFVRGRLAMPEEERTLKRLQVQLDAEQMLEVDEDELKVFADAGLQFLLHYQPRTRFSGHYELPQDGESVKWNSPY